jgi:hypothetical protein
MRMFATDFKQHRPCQCKHGLSYNHKFSSSWSVSWVHSRTISNSIVHDNLSIVSARIIDFDGPGVGHACFCRRF